MSEQKKSKSMSTNEHFQSNSKAFCMNSAAAFLTATHKEVTTYSESPNSDEVQESEPFNIN